MPCPEDHVCINPECGQEVEDLVEEE